MPSLILLHDWKCTNYHAPSIYEKCDHHVLETYIKIIIIYIENYMCEGVQGTQVGEGGKRRGLKKRIKKCDVHAPIPYNKSNHYVLQTHTSKKENVHIKMWRKTLFYCPSSSSDRDIILLPWNLMKSALGMSPERETFSIFTILEYK